MVRSLIAVLLLALTVGCSQGTGENEREKSAPKDTARQSSAPHQQVADPATLVIPAIDVRADVVGVGLNEDGSMETPAYDRNQAGWYIQGPRPGESGAAVVVGHLDNKTGDDVFADLGELRDGDTIRIVDAEGNDYTWRVDDTQQIDKDTLPYEKIWSGSSKPVLRLVTCAGAYDEEYEDNLIVYAKPV